MKILAKHFSLFLLTFLCSGIYGQNKRVFLPEKLTLLLDNKVKMVIESDEILKIPAEKIQGTILRNILTDINKSQYSLSKLMSPLKISYYIIDINSRKLKVLTYKGTKTEFFINGNSDTIMGGFWNYTIECNLGKNNRLIQNTKELSG